MGEIVEAASGVCRLLWIVDSSEPGASNVDRILHKLGKVVDSANCTAQEVGRLVDDEHPEGITSSFHTDLQSACVARGCTQSARSPRSRCLNARTPRSPGRLPQLAADLLWGMARALHASQLRATSWPS